MISFVAYDGSFNLSFHFSCISKYRRTALLHLISKFGTREWIIETSGKGKIYSLKKIVPHEFPIFSWRYWNLIRFWYIRLKTTSFIGRIYGFVYRGSNCLCMVFRRHISLGFTKHFWPSTRSQWKTTYGWGIVRKLSWSGFMVQAPDHLCSEKEWLAGGRRSKSTALARGESMEMIRVIRGFLQKSSDSRTRTVLCILNGKN